MTKKDKKHLIPMETKRETIKALVSRKKDVVPAKFYYDSYRGRRTVRPTSSINTPEIFQFHSNDS